MAAEQAEQRAAKARVHAEAAAQRASEATPTVRYPTLELEPSSLFLLGSPLGLLEALAPNGSRSLTPELALSTCSSVVNIFHPYDPLAYRLEPLLVEGRAG